MTEDHDRNRPVVRYTVGPFSISLWENDVDNGDGTRRSYKTVTVRKSFRKDGEFRHQSVSLNLPEIGCVISLLRKMEEAVLHHAGDVPF